jgi:hypothetical protein
MYEPLLFALGIIINLTFSVIFFLTKKQKLHLVRPIGIILFSITLPGTVILLILMIIEGVRIGFIVFGVFILLFLIIEILYDYVLKLEFRSDKKLLVPYLILYYAMNYALIALNWSVNLAFGIIVLILFIVQLIFNILKHIKNED